VAVVDEDFPTGTMHLPMVGFTQQDAIVLFSLIETFSNPGGTASCAG